VSTTVEILLVEDNPSAELVVESLRGERVADRVLHLGAEAKVDGFSVLIDGASS
jgi:hypothetical protein